MTLKIPEKVTKLAKPLAVTALAAVIVCGAVLTRPLWASSGASETAAASKEETVKRGDLTVGITESGTASLETEYITYPVSVEVEEVYVKAGQRVTAGEALLKVDLSALQDEYSTLEAAYDSALLSLEQAKQNQTTGAITAKYDYDSTVLGGQTAESQYDYTISEIAYNLSEQEDQVDELADRLTDLHDQRTELRTARSEASDAYSAARTAYTQAQAAYAADPTEENKTAMDTAQAEMDIAQANYEEIDEEYDKVCDDYSSTSSDLATAELKLEQLQSQEELDVLTAEADKNQTVAENENADTVYNATISQLASAVSAAQAEVNSAQKKMEEVAPYITDGIITAPVDGLVMSINCSEGDTMNADTQLVSLATSTTYVLLSVSQDDISDLELGMDVQMTFDAYEDEVFTGTVDSISYSATRMGSTSVSYAVTILVDGSPENIYEGMTCDATFITRQESDCLYVSYRAVTTAEDGTETVKLLTDTGETVVTPVTTGFSDGRNVQILSGLEEGDVVLIESRVNS
jgi:HlyD family secretion protein